MTMEVPTPKPNETESKPTEKNPTPEPPVPRAGKKKTILVLLIALILLIVMAITRRVPEPDPTLEPDIPVVAAPAVPEPLAAERIMVATSPIPVDQPNLLGVMRLRDIHGLPERLGSRLEAVSPALDAGTLRDAMAKAGFDPQHARPDGNAAWFAWKPDPIMSTPDVVALLPLRASAIDASSALIPSHFASVDGCPDSTLLAWDHAVLATASPISAGLRKIAQAPMDGDFSATLNLRRIWENYGTVARLYARTAQGAIGLGLMRHPALADAPQAAPFLTELINAASGAVFDALDQSLFMTLDIAVRDHHLELCLISEAQPDTRLAAAFSGGPLTAPDLLSLFPASEKTMMLSQETVADWNPALQGLRTVLRPAVRTLGSEPAAQFDDLLDRIRACGASTFAMRMRSITDPENQLPAMAAEYIILAENPDAMHRLLNEQLSYFFRDGVCTQFYKYLGIECRLRMETINGALTDEPIQRFMVTYEPTAEADPRLPEHAKAAIRRTFVYELARSGPYVFLTMDASANDLAQHVAAAQPADVHPLFNTYQPGMAAVGTIDLAALAAMIRRELENTPLPLPDVPWTALEAIDPLTYATYLQDGVRTTKFRIPVNLLAVMENMPDTPLP